MNNKKLQAIVTNNEGKKVKTITGTTNFYGYFWKQFNLYAKSKGYTIEVLDNNYTGGLAWKNKDNDILKFEWIK